MSRPIIVSPNLEYYDHPLPVVLNPGPAATPTAELRIDEDAWFVITSLQAEFTGRFTTLIKDSRGTNYTNIPIENAALWGTSAFPFYLPYPLVIPPNTALYLDLLDMTGVANTVRLVFSGYKHKDKARPPKIGLIRPDGSEKSLRDTWYVYAVNAALAASDDRSFPLKMDKASDFLIFNLRHYSAGNFETILSDPREKWSRDFVSRANGWGGIVGTAPSASLPRRLPRVKMMTTDSFITARIRDLSAAPNAVQLVFDGMKRYA